MFRKHPSRFDDDDWRVLQDRLAARGDPRGELIALTLASGEDASHTPALLRLRSELERPVRKALASLPIELEPTWSPLGWERLQLRVVTAHPEHLPLAELWDRLDGPLDTWLDRLSLTATSLHPDQVRPRHRRVRTMSLAFRNKGPGALDLTGLERLQTLDLQVGWLTDLRLPPTLRALTWREMVTAEQLARALATTPRLERLEVDFGWVERLDAPSLLGLFPEPSLPALSHLKLDLGRSGLAEDVIGALLQRQHAPARIQLRSRDGAFGRTGVTRIQELLYRWPATEVSIRGHRLADRDAQLLEHLGVRLVR